MLQLFSHENQSDFINTKTLNISYRAHQFSTIQQTHNENSHIYNLLFVSYFL